MKPTGTMARAEAWLLNKGFGFAALEHLCREAIMGNLRKLKDIVQEAVDKGATSVEEVHQAIAAMPLEMLESIEGLEEPAKNIKELRQKSIGMVYDIIRKINNTAGELAEDIIGKVEKDDDEEV